MALSPLTEDGELPLGVHTASLREVLDTGDARLLFDHAAAQAHFGASVFWVRHLAAWPGEEAAVEFWQVKRGGGWRGIVEIITEAS